MFQMSPAESFRERCAIGTQLDAGTEREMLWRCTVPWAGKRGGCCHC